MSNKKKTNNTQKSVVKTKQKSAPMTKKQIIFTIVAAILIVAIVATATVFIVRAMRGVKVNLMRDNLAKYVSISRDDYSNITLDIPLDEYNEQDLTQMINKVLAENKSKDPKYDGAAYKSEKITLGDVVSIMYRGYYTDKDGKVVEISSNFADGERVALEVGTGKIISDEEGAGLFITGFTDGMIGVVPSDYAAFAKYGEGKVAEGDVVYLTYTAFYPDSNGTYKQASAERINLNDDIDAIYGQGFKAFLLGTAEGTEAQSIGVALSSKTFPYGNGSAGYSDMKIEYVTRGCENAPLTIDVTFPVDYSEKSLRGVAAKFDVYISNAVIYDTPELDEKFITETLKLTADDLKDYDGANIVEKYKNYLIKGIKNNIENTNETVIIDALWEVLFSKTEVLKMPERTVDQYYDTYFNEVSYYYTMYKDYYTNIDAAARDYLSLSGSTTDWRTYLREKAEYTTTEEIIFYYIIREEGFLPSKAEFNEMRESIIGAHLAYHIDLNAEELDKLTGAAYDARVAEIKAEMIDYYGEEYFDENVYYNYGMDKIIEQFVTTK